jgi:hypothetical protein
MDNILIPDSLFSANGDLLGRPTRETAAQRLAAAALPGPQRVVAVSAVAGGSGLDPIDASKASAEHRAEDRS